MKKLVTAKQLETQVKEKTHRIWVLFGFTVLLGLLIAGLCVYIYKQDKAWKVRHQTQHSKVIVNGFTATELAGVTNMRPLYLVSSK